MTVWLTLANEFKAFIDGVLQREAYGGSLPKLAAAIGMTYSALNRAIEAGTLNIENLFGSAQV